MTDVIIAVIPAPGHEGLVENGPFGERPPRLRETVRGWFAPEGARPPWLPSGRTALVLHAPGGPRLGMVRAMEALGLTDRAWRLVASGSAGVVFDEYVDMTVDGWWSDRKRHTFAASPDTSILGASAYALAHLLHQRGLASEVLVLPVTP